MSRETTTIWVCQDCLIAHANGEIADDVEHAPLTKLEGLEVTLGITENEHNDWCELLDLVSLECGCEHIEFSPADCDGCEQTLAGERHALTLWTEE